MLTGYAPVLQRMVHEMQHAEQEVADAGEETRIASDLPSRLIIVDGHVALTPRQMDRWDEWLLVQSPLLVHAFSVMFETIWAAAKPFPPLPAEQVKAAAVVPELAADDQRLLVLLARGAEEYDIADRLDVTPRTIDRRVKRITTALGVRARFQLGLALSTGGWMTMLPDGDQV